MLRAVYLLVAFIDWRLPMRQFASLPSSRKREPASRISASRLLPILGLASAVGLYCGVEPNPPVAPQKPAATAPVPATGSAVPAGLRFALMQTAQREAGPEYALAPDTARTQPTLIARSTHAGIWAELGAAGLQVGSLRARQTAALSLALTHYGCDGALQETTPVSPRVLADRNRAEYVRPGFTEWYVNSPLGLEQGFTVDKDPGCRGDGSLIFGL